MERMGLPYFICFRMSRGLLRLGDVHKAVSLGVRFRSGATVDGMYASAMSSGQCDRDRAL